MNIHPRKTPGAAFTLIELLVVIAIILILAGLTIGALPGIQASMDRKQIKAFLQELQSGLSNYEIEYGNYPLNEPTGEDPSSRDTQGILGAAVLYKHLSGDYDPIDGELDDDGVAYVPNLLGKLQKRGKRRAIEDPANQGNYIVVDSFQNPIRYLAEKPNKKEAKLTYNPDYDIWSIADATGPPSNPDTRAKYITNWTRN